MLFEHEFVEGSFNLFEPQSSHQFDQNYPSINHIVNLDDWDPLIDGPTPQEHDSYYKPYNWYTIEWWENALLNLTVDWDGYTFRDLFDYEFSCNDYSIRTFDHLDIY